MTGLSIIFCFDYVTLPCDFVKIENDSIVFHNGHILKYSKTFYMVLLCLHVITQKKKKSTATCWSIIPSHQLINTQKLHHYHNYRQEYFWQQLKSHDSIPGYYPNQLFCFSSWGLPYSETKGQWSHIRTLWNIKRKNQKQKQKR